MITNSVRYDYSGAAVLVTGGTSGIGLAIASAYRDAGAHVVITGTRPSLGEYDGLDFPAADYRRLDVEDRDAIDGLAGSLGRLDILVHCGGIAMAHVGLDEYEPDVFDRAIAMHLTAVYRLSRRCLPLLTESSLAGGASVVGIASMASYFAIGHAPGYGAGKAGLVQLVKTMGLAWVRHNVRASAVAAGLTLTRMASAGLARDPARAERTLARMPVGRFGQPADIAAPVLFLTSQWLRS